MIDANEGRKGEGTRIPGGEDQLSCNNPNPKSNERLVLGVWWDVDGDKLVFNINDICHLMMESQPTKRAAVSLATRFFDPLGVMSPITVWFKLSFQRTCEARVDLDGPLNGELLMDWKCLISDLQHSVPISMPWCVVLSHNLQHSYSLQGFCNVSQRLMWQLCTYQLRPMVMD